MRTQRLNGRTRRYRPNLDNLETRLVLSTFGSTSTLAINLAPLTSPLASISSSTPGTAAAPGDTALTLTLASSVDPFSFDPSSMQITLQGSDPSGTGAPLNFSITADSTDTTGRRFLVTTETPLVAGSYQVTLNSDFPLQDVTGASLTDSANPVLTQFEIKAPVVVAPVLTNLGAVSSSGTVAGGRLDPARGIASALYQFSVPAGSTANTTISVTANSTTGELDSAVTLLDATGKTVGFAEGGNPTSPLDPILRASLVGGTYTAVVTGNLVRPGANGSFQINVTGTAVTIPVTANPTTPAPTSVTRVTTDHDNPRSNQPTGLTLRFSNPLSVTSLETLSGAPLNLVDSTGKTWPLKLTRGSSDQTTFSFQFDQAIPVGSYDIQAANGVNLVDLSGKALPGLSPTSASLARVTISATSGGDPSDLGTLWNKSGSTVSTSLTLAPTAQATRTFTALGNGTIKLKVSGQAAGLVITARDSKGASIGDFSALAGTYDPVSDTTVWSFPALPGSDTVQVSNTAATPRTVNLSLTASAQSSASLLDTGADQTSAVRLETVNPAVVSSLLGPFASTGSAGTTSTPGRTSDSVATFTSSSSSVVSGPGSGLVPATLSVSLGGLSATPIGAGESLGAVALSGGSSVGGVAANQSLTSADRLTSLRESRPMTSRTSRTKTPPGTPAGYTISLRHGGPVPVVEQVVNASPADSGLRVASAERLTPTAANLHQTDEAFWLDRLALNAGEGADLSTSGEGLGVELDDDAIGQPSRRSGRPARESSNELASFSPTVVAVGTALMLYHSRVEVQRWTRRTAQAVRNAARGLRVRPVGPHAE